MTRYLLDTNVVIELLRSRESKPAVRARLESPADLSLSAISVHELYFGAFRSRRPAENAALIDALQFTVLEIDREDGRAAGQLRALLASRGTPIGTLDVLIAGQALARDMTLVTHNVREFERIASLKIEDWQS